MPNKFHLARTVLAKHLALTSLAMLKIKLIRALMMELSTLRTSSLLVISGILASCSGFAPDYTAPRLDLPKYARQGVKFESSSTDLAEYYWWEKLGDQQLNALVESALKYNNQILSAKSNMLQAKAKLNQAQFSWIPTLNGDVGGFIGNPFSGSITPQGNSPLANSLPRNLNNDYFRGMYGAFMPGY